MKNPDDRWGVVSQSLHWLVVVLILVMAYLGLTMTDLPNTPYKIRVYALHKSIGLSILALVALRLLWRWYAGAPRELPGPGWQRRAAALTHAGLYLLLFAVPVSGWVMNSAAGFPLPWFGLVHLPPLVGHDEALHELSEDWHEWLFWALVGLSLAHAAAAFWHHLFQRDATLARMLPRRWLRVPASEESPDA
jgi:cytochrome b561